MNLTVEQMVARRMAQETASSIARAAGVRLKTVTAILREAMGARLAATPQWTDERLKTLREMAALDPPVRWDVIADALEMETKSVQGYARKHGIEKQPCPRGVSVGAKYMPADHDDAPAVKAPSRDAEAKLMAGIQFDAMRVKPSPRRFVPLPATVVMTKVEGHW